MDIARSIKKFLKVSGWNVYQLAQRTGVPASSLYRLINGQRKSIRTDTLEKLWPYLFGDKSPLQVSCQTSQNTTQKTPSNNILKEAPWDMTSKT